MNPLNVLIAGGGIGGMTAALCLARQGCQVNLFEQAPEITEIGAGIQLSPNCTRVLHHLGLEKALREIAFLPEATEFRHWRDGRVIASSPLGEPVRERYGFPYYHVHRADLIRLLIDAAKQQPGINLQTGIRIETVQQDAAAVTVSAAEQSWSGDLLIGADGIHSTTRAFLWGDDQPVFTGNVAWRALVPAAALSPGLVKPMSTVWWGPGKHFVHYFVRAGELVNCVCVVEKPGWEIESWTEHGDHAELAADFSGWHETVAQLIAHAEPASLYKWALYDRPPMPQWGQGRVTLLGDACHPTLPFMAQGAAMAIEDAAVLANCLSREEPVTALQHYEGLRRERTARIQKGSRRNARVFHLRGPATWFRNRAAGFAGERTMASLFSYNALDQ